MKPGQPIFWRNADGEVEKLPDPARIVYSPEKSLDMLTERCPAASAGLRESCSQGFVRFVEFDAVCLPAGPDSGKEVVPGGTCFMITAPSRGFEKMSDDQVIAFMRFGSELAKELEELGQAVLV